MRDHLKLGKKSSFEIENKSPIRDSLFIRGESTILKSL